jgi:hypothetical protein
MNMTGQEIVSVASRVFNPKHDELRPAVSKELYQLERNIWYTKCPTIGRFLHSFVVLYFVHNYMHTYRIFEWDQQCAVVISYYCLMLKPYWKSFRNRRQAHYVPNIAHFNLLLWFDENSFRKGFNAVSLAVRSTWPPNCAHIIIIHSAEFSVWYFFNILLFHVQKLFNWFYKYVQ